MSALERLQLLFRELFQLDLADLDFGIYRLLHMKREEVEAFLLRTDYLVPIQNVPRNLGAGSHRAEWGGGHFTTVRFG